MTLSRKAEAAESIVLALSSGLYDYTSCSSKVRTKATGIDNQLTADTAPPPWTGSSIDPEDARDDGQAC